MLRLRGRAARAAASRHSGRAKRRPGAAQPPGSHLSAGAALGVKRGPPRPLLAVRHLGFHRCPEYLWEAPQTRGLLLRTHGCCVSRGVKDTYIVISPHALLDSMPTTQHCPDSTPHYTDPCLKECIRAIANYTHTHKRTHTRVFWAAPCLLIQLMTILKHMLTVIAQNVSEQI